MTRANRLSWLNVAVFMTACGGSTEQPDPETLIQSACDKVVSLQCSDSVTRAQCDTALHEQREEAVSAGCAAEFDAVLACMGQRLTQCDQLMSEICGPELQALDECQHPGGGDECSMGVGPAQPGAPSNYQSCFVSCPSWDLKCETDAAGVLVCTCTEGPKAGTSFTVESCNTSLSDAGAQYCAG